jgi:alkylation response protein AidB-like acyl-CoA dehydrogenase
MEMLEAQLTSEDRAFRDEVQEWLSEHLRDEFAAHRGVGGLADDHGWDVRVRWDRELAAAGLLCIGWPEQYGGRGAPLVQEVLLHYEMAKANAPYRAGHSAQDLLGPLLLAIGTDEQKRRFLPPIAAGQELWCQGFSEPNAGSDLANVQTRAEREGDKWVITGQKVWTGLAHHADWMFMLCRTDRDAPRHRGLTMLIVPTRQPGIEIRPIDDLTGGGHFCEVFFDRAETDADLVIGDVNGGWAAALTTLGIERGTELLPHQLAMEREAYEMLDVAREQRRLEDPTVSMRIVDAWMGAQVMRFSTLRSLSAVIGGRAQGPEGSIVKLLTSEWHQRLCELQFDLVGPEAATVGEGYALSDVQRRLLESRSETIYGGTSEIQRNVIAERILGLPREPRPTTKSAA